MNPNWTLVIAVSIPFTLSAGLMPFVIRLAHRRRWYDLPDSRKIHKGLIPRIGGTLLWGSTIAGAAAVSAVLLLLPESRQVPGFFAGRFLFLFLGVSMIHFLGLVDDFRDLPAAVKLSVQLLSAAFITLSGLMIRSVSIPYVGTVHLGIFSYPLTVLWIMGFANAINLLDGMDGLAGGVVVIASLALGAIGVIQGHLLSAVLSLALFGSTAGFLLYNLPPARIFMGDSGSYFLGTCLAVIPLLGVSKAASVGTLIIPLTLLTVPIIDTLAAIVRRIRKRRSPLSPDKEHIHHKLLDMGFSERKILILVYSFSLYLGLVAIGTVVLPREANVFIIVVVWVGSLLSYYLLDNLRRNRKSAEKENRKRKVS
jgi:UDP-GlcNAc:undecaprenyl-phosphate GlcNAc-1-phosphate transferase